MNIKHLNQINSFIETELAPPIRGHGGEIHLNQLSGSTVYLELTGACVLCPIDNMTKDGIKLQLISKFDFLDDVVFEENQSSNEDNFKLKI